MATKWRLERRWRCLSGFRRGIEDNFDLLLSNMVLELKLHSPAGAEPLVYSWPLLKSVSFWRPVFGLDLYFVSKKVMHQFC